MTIDEVKKLIAKDETRTLELKKTTGELHRGMETACAFLNSDGGWLMFGIAPNLKITGQNVTDATRQEIANALRKIEPAVDVEVEYIELPDKPDFYVIAIYFDAANFKNGPYSFDGRAFYKVESTTAVMPRTMYEERLKLSNPRRFSWENMPNPELRVEDIDAEMVFQTLHDGIGARRIPASNMTLQTPLQVMQKLGVARNDGVLLNAANALFGLDPTMHHIQCKVRLARFEGTNKLVFRDQTVCEGNLFKQYDAVIDFCLKHLNLAGRMDSKFRQDTLTVPYTAIKEAAINMLCHRSWNADNLTPSLAIYDDRMVFQNPGAFPPGMSWKDFVDDSIGSMPLNPTIANVFYRRGTMESWGRGISLIMQSCREQGLPEPKIEIVPNFVNLTIWFKDLLSAQDSPQDPPRHPKTPQVTPQVHQLNQQSEVSAVQNKIIKFCQTPRSVAEIAEMLGVKDKKWVKDKYMKPLIGSKLALSPIDPIADIRNIRLLKISGIIAGTMDMSINSDTPSNLNCRCKPDAMPTIRKILATTALCLAAVGLGF